MPIMSIRCVALTVLTRLDLKNTRKNLGVWTVCRLCFNSHIDLFRSFSRRGYKPQRIRPQTLKKKTLSGLVVLSSLFWRDYRSV